MSFDIHEYHTRRISFQGKRLVLPFKPRTGKCSRCGKKGKTHLHHERYDPKKPVAHTVELCASCHSIITWQVQAGRPIRNQYMKEAKLIKKVNISGPISCEHCHNVIVQRPNETNPAFQKRRFCGIKCVALWSYRRRTKLDNGRLA